MNAPMDSVLVRFVWVGIAVAFGTAGLSASKPASAAFLGPSSITQTVSTTPLSDNSLACDSTSPPYTSENHYWRRFYFNEYSSFSSVVDISSVDVSVQESNGQTISVRLHTIPHAVTVDTIDESMLTQIGSVDIAVPDGTQLASVIVPFAVSLQNSVVNDLVVEVISPDGQSDGTFFYIGSNSAGETHPNFISSAACGISVPTTTSALGDGNMRSIIVVNLASDGIFVDAFEP